MFDSITKYHEPDRRWKPFGVNSYEDFYNKFMVPGRFHKNVPFKIVQDYQIVERLLCYSYYYYPLIDEAFSKATRLFEASINQRLSELKISIQKNEKLISKIEKLEPYTSSEVLKEWNKAREIRNYFAHPSPGNLMGVVVHRSFLQMVNIINTIFIDRETFELYETELLNFKKIADVCKDGLFSFEFENQKILIWSILPYSCYKNGDILKSFWVFHPVFKSFPQTDEKLFFDLPICLSLKNIQIEENLFKAVNNKTGSVIEVSRNDQEENINQLIYYKKQILSSDHRVKEIYWNYLESELTFEIVKFLYFECWE